MTLDEQIDEILHKYWEGIAWDIGPEPRNDDPAKQAITQLIADEVKKAMWQFGLEKDVKYDVKKSDKVIVITPTQPSNKSKE